LEHRGEGWVLFAGIVLIWGGIMKVFDGIWAFRYHGVLPSNLEAAIFGHSLKTYGWVDLIVAAILIICGFLVISGSSFARWVGIVAATIAGISAIWWMPFYPIWSFVYIFIAALVIYALAVFGGDREAERDSALR
jgi:cellulose synthase/poly-beta-1,6-N-acetylglucosamine synthase-like glycosyltransferase